MNINICDIAREHGGTAVDVSHSRGTLTSSNATAAQANAEVTNAGIGSLTFNGGAANAERAADLVNHLTSGQGQVYQSTHQNDLIGTVIGGNASTGGNDLGFFGVWDAHSTYGPGHQDQAQRNVWGTDSGSRSVLVPFPNSR